MTPRSKYHNNAIVSAKYVLPDSIINTPKTQIIDRAYAEEGKLFNLNAEYDPVISQVSHWFYRIPESGAWWIPEWSIKPASFERLMCALLCIRGKHDSCPVHGEARVS